MGKQVQLKAADGHQFDAYVAEPAGTPRGLVVIAPEIFGVNSHIKSVADGYAADGYLAVAAAYFDRAQRNFDSGYSQPEIAAGVEIMKQVKFDDVMLDVAAVLEFGKSAGKAGIVGYCWGGVIAFLAAARVPGLAAASSYYGGALPNFITEKLKCPLEFHFGETDHSITLEKAKEVAAAYPDNQAFYYPAGHGFNCDQRGSYDAASAKLAKERTLALFHKYVG
jgi:carboxymethylenebutenolidase